MRLLITIFFALLLFACSPVEKRQEERVYFSTEENVICFPASWAGSYSSFAVSSISGDRKLKLVVYFFSQGDNFSIVKGSCVNLWDGPSGTKKHLKRAKLMSGTYVVRLRYGHYVRSADFNVK